MPVAVVVFRNTLLVSGDEFFFMMR